MVPAFRKGNRQRESRPRFRLAPDTRRAGVPQERSGEPSRDRGAMRTEPRIPAPDPVRAEQDVPFLLTRVRGRSWLARCVSRLARCGLLRIYQTPVAHPMRN